MQTITTTATCFALALAIGPPRARVDFGPEEGLTLTKTFSNVSNMTLEDFSLTVDGNDMGAMMGSFELDVEVTSDYVVTDEYVAIVDGRPTKLRRTFDAIEAVQSTQFQGGGMSDGQDTESSSDLVGTTVVFEWDEDTEEYGVEFDGESAEERLLEGLAMDMDLLFAMPGREVEEGDSWDIDLVELRHIMMPGGNLHLTSDDASAADMAEIEEMMSDVMSGLVEDFKDLLEGEATATFTGMREEDGVELAVIELSIDVSIASDVSEIAEEIIARLTEEMGDQLPIDFSIDLFDVEAEATAEGELLWNVTAGHLHSLDLPSEYVFALDIEVEAEAEGQGQSIAAFVEMSVESTLEVSVE